MLRPFRPLLLVSTLVLAVPALVPVRAMAAANQPQADLGIPRPVMRYLKANWQMIYIAFDELIDDLTGCDCPPPPPVPNPALSPGVG